jgi:hypothetical protein
MYSQICLGIIGNFIMYLGNLLYLVKYWEIKGAYLPTRLKNNVKKPLK